jgi:hypothetical protein
MSSSKSVHSVRNQPMERWTICTNCTFVLEVEPTFVIGVGARVAGMILRMSCLEDLFTRHHRHHHRQQHQLRRMAMRLVLVVGIHTQHHTMATTTAAAATTTTTSTPTGSIGQH